MTHFYSPSLPGFIDDRIIPNLPEDAIELTMEAYTALLEGQGAGQAIALADGKVVLIDRPLQDPIE